MNLPFKFAAASTDAILVLDDDTTNLVLSDLKGSTLTEAQKARFGLLNQPRTPGWLYTLAISADKDVTLAFGVYDTVAAVFYSLYPVSLLAAGSNEHVYTFNTGLAAPLGGAVAPAIKVILGTTVILTGHVEFIRNVADDAAPFNTAPIDPIIE